MKRKHRRLRVHRLKLKPLDYIMLVGVAISISFLMIAFAMYTESAKSNQIELVQVVMEKMAANQKQQFESFVNDKIDVLQALAEYPEIYEMDEAKQEALIKGHSKDWGFNHIFVMNANGTGYYIEEGVHRNQKHEVFFEQIMSADVVKTDPFYLEDGTPILTACVSIRDENREKVGVLCGAIKLDGIQQIIRSNKMILDGQCFIVDKKGVYLTSDDARKVKNKVSVFATPNSDLQMLYDAIARKEDTTGTLTLDGVEYEAFVTYLKDSNWLVVQIISIEKITELYASLSIMQIVLGFFIVLLMFCMVRIIYRWNKSNNKIYTDTLTKCNSRAACLDLLDSLEDSRKWDITIVYMDLNRVKYGNDTYGHDKGDELLCIFSEVLEQTLGQIGFVGRMGGDEFIAVLLDTSEEELKEMWGQLEAILSEKSKLLDFDYEIVSSYGYATREKASKEPLDAVMQRADVKMYEYKTLVKQL